MLPVAILAGGYGTRLGALTQNTQKCMIDVNGRPFLEHVLTLLNKQGACEVVLCIGHLGDQVEDRIGDGSRFGLDVTYSRDGEPPLGTAAALLKALPLLGDRFFVLYGDSYLPCDLRAVQAAYEHAHTLGLMVVCTPPDGYTANVQFEGGQVWDYDKLIPSEDARHIDYGLGILDRRALIIPGLMTSDLSDVYASLALQTELAGYLSPERFYTVGTPAGLDKTCEYLADHAIR